MDDLERQVRHASDHVTLRWNVDTNDTGHPAPARQRFRSSCPTDQVLGPVGLSVELNLCGFLGNFGRPEAAPAAGRDVDPGARGDSASRNSAWDVVLPPARERMLAHPAECAPRRTPRNPKWMPPRDRRAPVRGGPAGAPAGWGRARIEAAPDAGAVRVGMNWRKSFVTSALFCFKSGRPMFFEGPHEIASYRLRAITHTCTDIQFQPLVLHWMDDEERAHAYFVDSVEETDAGTLVFRENKAHTAYFEDARIGEKLAAAEAELVRHPNVTFEREVGTDLMHPLRWRIAKDIFDDRTVGFDDRRRDAVTDLLVRKGEASLGDVWETIGGDRDDARRVANAMLSKRIVGYRVDRVPVADTRVVRPARPARPGLLRSFLRRFAPEAE